EIEEIRYGILEEDDLPEVAKLIGDVFSRFEPLAIVAGLTPADISAYVLLFGPKVVAEALAVIARDPSGQMVGTLFSDDLGNLPPDVNTLPERFAPVGALLESLSKQYLSSQRIIVGSHVQLMILAVLPVCFGKGIAQNLIKTVIDNAARRGYHFAI